MVGDMEGEVVSNGKDPYEYEGSGSGISNILRVEGPTEDARLDALRALVAEMWANADDWHGPVASSHYRSRIRERAEALGVQIRRDR